MTAVACWIRIAAVVAAMGVCVIALRALARRRVWDPEVARKTVHVTMGVTCLLFPWLFDRVWPVWVLAALATAGLAALRWLPAWRAAAGGLLHDVGRFSLGDLLFGPAVAVVFTLSGDRPELFVIPILILTTADAAAALVGTRWGKTRYGTRSGSKSVEGSVAFAIAAAVCVALPLGLFADVGTVRVLLIAATLALLAMMAEGIADRGFDNLTLPIGAHFLLAKFLAHDVPPLWWRLTIAGGLLAAVIMARRWTTLDGGALLAAALLGFGLGALGGATFLAPVFGVFALHLITTHRHALSARVTHGIDGVLGVAIAALPWAMAATRLGWKEALAGLSVAMMAKLALMDLSTRRFLGLGAGAGRIAPAIAKGLLAGALPGLVWLPVGEVSWMVGAGLILTMVSAWWYARHIAAHGLEPPRVFLAEGALALVASALAWFVGRF